MNPPTEVVSTPATDVLKNVSAQTLVEALLDRVKNGCAEPPPQIAASLPTIGAAYHGGIYAGFTLDAGKPVALVLLPGDDGLPWKYAIAWAEKQGGMLPSRIDQLVLFQNLKNEFLEALYWSGEQYALTDAFAWYQSFYDGSQGYGHKGYDYRARAVRRLPIE